MKGQKKGMKYNSGNSRKKTSGHGRDPAKVMHDAFKNAGAGE